MSENRPSFLEETARQIWKAGVDAVNAETLVRQNFHVDESAIRVGDHEFERKSFDRLLVLGAGKAAGWMARGVQQSAKLAGLGVYGWINVPESQVIECGDVTVFNARPDAENLPTKATLAGSKEIIRLLAESNERDFVLFLFSGGGSALLEEPVEGVSLDDIRQMTTFLSSAGADIGELNTVRKKVSRLKGGGLADLLFENRPNATAATLLISDVLGDSIDMIAAGPTVTDLDSSQLAFEILIRFDSKRAHVPKSIWSVLEDATEERSKEGIAGQRLPNIVIGNNSVACDAAATEARKIGIETVVEVDLKSRFAEDVGRDLVHRMAELCNRGEKICLVSGGEPIVRLCESPRLGGRNQQLVLAGLIESLQCLDALDFRFCLLSGGTDGEDGNVACAGAWFDDRMTISIREPDAGTGPSIEELEQHLEQNNAYRMFQKLNGLHLSASTKTNVCDLRICLIMPRRDGATVNGV